MLMRSLFAIASLALAALGWGARRTPARSHQPLQPVTSQPHLEQRRPYSIDGT